MAHSLPPSLWFVSWNFTLSTKVDVQVSCLHNGACPRCGNCLTLGIHVVFCVLCECSMCYWNFYDADDLDEFLTMAEKQKIILHELEAVRSIEAGNPIPGFRNISLYKGEAISGHCLLSYTIISSINYISEYCLSYHIYYV